MCDPPKYFIKIIIRFNTHDEISVNLIDNKRFICYDKKYCVKLVFSYFQVFDSIKLNESQENYFLSTKKI